MNRLLLIGLLYIVPASAQTTTNPSVVASPFGGKATQSSTPASKPQPGDQLIISDYRIDDYSFLESGQSRALREISTNQEKASVAKKKISAASGYGGNEVVARANSEIKEAEFAVVKAKRALVIIGEKEREWAFIKNQPLLPITSTDGKSIKAYVISSTPATLRIATAEGRVFNLDTGRLSEDTLKLLQENRNETVPQSVTASGIQSPTTAKRKSGAITIKGVWIGMPVVDAIKELTENKQVDIAISPKKGTDDSVELYQISYKPKPTSTPTTDEASNGGGLCSDIKTGCVTALLLDGRLSDILFNTGDLPLTTFAQNFIAYYQIPELKSLVVRGRPALHYESPYGWSIYIWGDKSVELFQTPPRQFD